MDTGVFDEDRYFDIFIEYAKHDSDDILARVTVINRGPDPASLHLIADGLVPQYMELGLWKTPSGIDALGFALHRDFRNSTLGEFKLWLEGAPPLLFTENESNSERLWNSPNPQPYVKDAFHRYLIQGKGCRQSR